MFLYTNEYVHHHEKDQRYDARIMRYNMMENLIENRHINKMSSMQMATEILQQTKEDIAVKSLSNKISSEIRKLEEMNEEKMEELVEDGNLQFSVTEDDDMRIYGNPDYFNRFKETKILFVDGTFKICPSLLK